MKYIIIGNGPAAVGTIEGIRQVDKSGEITVISSEKHHTYSRPLISYYLEGKTDSERIKYRPDNFYTSNGCTVLYGRSAEKIDAQAKTVTLDGGDTLNYDKLCVCTGSSPFTPPFEGLNTVTERCSFMTFDDALALEKAVTKDSRVLIIGAGLIGLKCAEGLYDRAGSITVVDLATRVLSSILDDQCAAVIQKQLEDKGLTLLLGDSVKKFYPNSAEMQSGKTVDFDVLVTAVGVRPNVSLVKDAGGKVNRGIAVDTRSQTDLDSVFAAGDCTECFDISSGTSRILAIWPNAYLQGECAGVNMAGGDKVFSNSIPMNAIGFFGLHMITAGTYTGEVFEEFADGNVKKMFYSDNKLNGFILIGNVDKAGIYTSLIRNQTDLRTIDFDLVIKRPTLLAFQQDYRRAKLGGVV